MNIVTKEIQDTLFLGVYSPIDDWVLDLGASFYNTSHQEIIQNYVVNDFEKMFIADREALDVIRVEDMGIILLNRSMWTLQCVRHVIELKKSPISVKLLDIRV